MNNHIQPVLAFCHLRKTGGVTFNQILRREFGVQHIDAITRYPDGRNVYRSEDLEQDRVVYPRIKSIAGHGLRPFLNYGEFGNRMRWITLLRNPSERYVSHYIHHVEKFGYDKSFRVWIDIHKHQNDQTKTIAGIDDVEQAKRILKEFFWIGFTDQYVESMKILEVCLGDSISTKYTRKSNVARGNKFDKEALVEGFADDIRRRNQLDWELYEFARNQLWPRQKALFSLHENHVRPRPKKFGVWASRFKRNVVYKPFVRLSRVH